MDVNKITAHDLEPEVGKTYRLTVRNRSIPTQDFVTESFLVTIFSVEERNFGYYFGYRPLSTTHGQFGFKRLEWCPPKGNFGLLDMR